MKCERIFERSIKPFNVVVANDTSSPNYLHKIVMS